MRCGLAPLATGRWVPPMRQLAHASPSTGRRLSGLPVDGQPAASMSRAVAIRGGHPAHRARLQESPGPLRPTRRGRALDRVVGPGARQPDRLGGLRPRRSDRQRSAASPQTAPARLQPRRPDRASHRPHARAPLPPAAAGTPARDAAPGLAGRPRAPRERSGSLQRRAGLRARPADRAGRRRAHDGQHARGGRRLPARGGSTRGARAHPGRDPPAIDPATEATGGEAICHLCSRRSGRGLRIQQGSPRSRAAKNVATRSRTPTRRARGPRSPSCP